MKFISTVVNHQIDYVNENTFIFTSIFSIKIFIITTNTFKTILNITFLDSMKCVNIDAKFLFPYKILKYSLGAPKYNQLKSFDNKPNLVLLQTESQNPKNVVQPLY